MFQNFVLKFEVLIVDYNFQISIHCRKTYHIWCSHGNAQEDQFSVFIVWNIEIKISEKYIILGFRLEYILW